MSDDGVCRTSLATTGLERKEKYPTPPIGKFKNIHFSMFPLSKISSLA